MNLGEMKSEIRRVEKTITAKKSQSRNNMFPMEKQKTITELRELNGELSKLKKHMKNKHKEVKNKRKITVDTF